MLPLGVPGSDASELITSDRMGELVNELVSPGDGRRLELDERLAAVRVGGALRVRNAERFVDALRRLLPVSVTRDGDVTRVKLACAERCHE